MDISLEAVSAARSSCDEPAQSDDMDTWIDSVRVAKSQSGSNKSFARRSPAPCAHSRGIRTERKQVNQHLAGITNGTLCAKQTLSILMVAGGR